MGILRTDRVSGLGGANAIKGSVFFDGGSTLTVEDSDDFHYDTGDFTIEGWIFATGRDNQMMLLGQWDGAGSVAGSLAWAVQLTNNSNGFLRFLTSSTGTNVVLNQNGTSGTVFDNQWHHFAVTRNGNDYKLFMDGVVVGSVTDSNAITNSPFPLTIGGSNKRYVSNADSSQTFTGFLSNIRIIKGEALYTAAFTPPTSELTVTSNTVFLGCQSSNILREETGKILSIDKSSANNSGPIPSRFTPHSPSTFSQYVDQGTNSGTTFDGVTTFDSQAYFVPPGEITRNRVVKSNGDIVSGNLIFHLDGGDSKSYAGVTTSGSIIYDLKEGTNSTGVGIATMTTGHTDFERVTWVPDNRGCFRQSSDSDFGTITGNMINFPQISLGNDNYTINVWVKLNSIPQGGDEQQIVISNKDGGPVSFLGYLKNVSHRLYIAAGAYYSSWSYKYSTTTAMNIGQWYLLTWVNTAQYTGSMYVNGELQTLDDGNTTWNSRSSNNTPLNSTSYAGSETFDGWIGQIQFYSDTLSATEILQNYNAHKCRYIY